MSQTLEQFIERAKAVHGDKYDYSKVNYINCDTKVEIICKKHGSFFQTPYAHYKLKNGCPVCRDEKLSKSRRLTNEQFIEKAKAVHGNLYDYSKVNYIRAFEPVEIICKVHGSFWQKPCNHILSKQGCPECAGKKSKTKENCKISAEWKKTTEGFIEAANKVHNNKYDYSKTVYVNMKSKVEIICKKHGSFFQYAYVHIYNGCGCPECKRENALLSEEEREKAKNLLIERAKAVHGDKYDYSKVNYVNSETKVEIICKKHGSFWQIPNIHFQGKGCPKCKTSHGEDKIREYLQKSNIAFEEQKRFKDCKDKYTLPFDFFIPSENTAIEYNGEQHYKPISYFGGRKKFLNQKHHDWLKRKYCKDKGITLIVIKYNDSIEEKLNV